MAHVKKKIPGKKHSNARGKYIGGQYFASRAEAYRFLHLKRLEKAGTIQNLQLQPRFELWVENKKICTYVADFRYQQIEDVVEDVKGRIFPVYALKLKMYRALYPEHNFCEVRAIRRSKKRLKTTWKVNQIK